MTFPEPIDRADWHAVRDLPRSRVAPVLAARAAARGITAGALRARLIRFYGAEAELLPTTPAGRPTKRPLKTLAGSVADAD